MTNGEWLDTVQSGLAIRSPAIGTDTVVRIERTTKSQIVLSSGEKFYRRTGRAVGQSGYSSVRLRAGTNEEVRTLAAENKRLRMASALSHRNWSKLPLSVLEQVNAVLESHSQVKEEG